MQRRELGKNSERLQGGETVFQSRESDAPAAMLEERAKVDHGAARILLPTTRRRQRLTTITYTEEHAYCTDVSVCREICVIGRHIDQAFDTPERW